MVWVRPFYKLLLYRISCCTCSQGLTGGKSPSAPSPPFFFLLSWSRRQTLKLISRSAAECPLVQSLVSCGSSHYSSNQFPKQLSSWPIGKPLNLAIQGISIPISYGKSNIILVFEIPSPLQLTDSVAIVCVYGK